MDTTKLSRDYKKYPLTRGGQNGLKYERIPYKDLYELYVIQDLQKKEICEYFNLLDGRLKIMLKEYGIKKPERKINYDEVINLYINENLTIQEVAKILGYHTATIQSFILKNNIEKSNDQITESRNRTVMKMYGVKNVFQSDNIKNKSKETCLEKYGKEHWQSTEEHKNKVKETKLERYGDENYNNIDKQKQTCLDRYGIDNSQKKITSKFGYDLLEDKDRLEQYIKDNNIINMVHLSRTLDIKEHTVQMAIKKHGLKKLFDYTKSIFEQEIKEYVSQFYNIECNLLILDGKELDIYIPELKLGIECNGSYWHNEYFKPQKYHYDKSKAGEEQGIFVYHIFEHEWYNNKIRIKNQLDNLLHINKQKIYARKCQIKELDSSEKNEFLEQNHIQGKDNCQIKLGLYFEEELVSVMTFCTPRFNKKYEWELSRYCSKSGYNVIGGASKLFKYFVNTYNPNNILSYSDIAKTRGLIYNTLGFSLDHIAKPNYVWVNHIKEYKTRYQCQKHKLLAQGLKGKSELEIMKNLDYFRVFDSGNKVWIWKK